MSRTTFQQTGLVLALMLIVAPRPASAVTFAFDHLFDVAAYGATSTGTPRGLEATPGGLLVSDALDDHVYLVDLGTEQPSATYETNPFVCAPANPGCVPTQEWSRVAADVAWDGTGLWLVDKETINGSSTWLIELNASGEYIDRYDVSATGAAPGGLTHDARGGGAFLITDRNSDWVSHVDSSGTVLGISSLKPGGTGAETATGITHFAGDLFLVSDATGGKVHEFEVPAGGGAAVLEGESSFQGFDVSTLADLQGVTWDAGNETLYLLDGATDAVYVFTLVPEPGTALLFASGLAVMAGMRGRQRRR